MNKSLRQFLTILFTFLFPFVNPNIFPYVPKDYVFKPKIILTSDSVGLFVQFEFPRFLEQGKIIISKKSIHSDFWEKIDTLNANFTNYLDTIPITNPEPIEYGFHFASDTFNSYGYYLVGNKTTFEIDKGNVLVLIDSTVYISIEKEISRFASDLIADGWNGEIKIVSRCETFNPIEVRKVKRIVNKYQSMWGNKFKALIFVGRVPVPYTGNYTFDGHSDHMGAFPSDLVYVVADSGLSDENEYNIGAIRKENWNVPFDGKYDQTTVPTQINIAIGRIDFSNLTDFPENETELLKKYFNKNHFFRMGNSPKETYGLIDDGFGTESHEIFSASAWMNFIPLCDSIVEGKFSDNLKKKYFRFSYACNSGSYTSIWSSINSEICAKDSIQTTFAFLLGSYLWDWDTERNLLRSLLASNPSTLLVAWIGRPNWHFHHLVFDYPFSFSFIKTANNIELYSSPGIYGKKGMHLEIFGDPTLRISYPKPPSNFSYNFINDSTINLKWALPEDTTNFIGFLVVERKENEINQKVSAVQKQTNEMQLKISKEGKLEFLLIAVYKKDFKFGSTFELSSGLLLRITKR